MAKTVQITTAAPGDWMENFTVQSTGDHILIGFSTLLVAVLFTTSAEPIFWTEIGLLIFVLAKEYGYDLREESGETWKSSTVDALGYVGGNIAAWALVYFSHRLG